MNIFKQNPVINRKINIDTSDYLRKRMLAETLCKTNALRKLLVNYTVLPSLRDPKQDSTTTLPSAYQLAVIRVTQKNGSYLDSPWADLDSWTKAAVNWRIFTTKNIERKSLLIITKARHWLLCSSSKTFVPLCGKKYSASLTHYY